MTRRQLQRIERRLNALYGSDRKSSELEGLATTLGRAHVKRGSYTWESKPFPHLPPLSIPYHSKGVKRFTAEGILDQMAAQDVWEWNLFLEAQGQ